MLAEPQAATAAMSPAGVAPGRRFGDCQAPLPMGTARQTWPRDAAILRRYVAECEARGVWPPNAVLTVVDLAPADGARAWHMLRELANDMPRLRYVAACTTDAQAASLCAHPALQSALQTRRLQVRRQASDEAGWRACLSAPDTPVVILAHGLCSALRHDLHACHYGAWMDGWVDAAAGAEPSLSWRGEAPSSPLAALLAPHYLRSLNSAALLLPTGAAASLAPLLRACAGRYLLLASDPGVAQLAELRSGALAVRADQWQEALPVNFHALCAWLDAGGAQCTVLGDAGEDEALWLLALQDDACIEGMACLPGLRAAWSQAAGDDEALLELAWRLAAGATRDPCDTAQALALWRAASYAPRLLLALETVLVPAAGAVRGLALEAWCQALKTSCAHYFPPAEDDGFLCAAASLASALGQWGMAIALLQQESDLYDDGVATLRLRAQCLQRVGDARTARGLLLTALAAAPTEPGLRDELAALDACLARWSSLPWYAESIAYEGGLCLQPLGPEHAEAYLFQYRDPQIGMMTRLPEFASADDWREWIDGHRAERGRMDFALMHAGQGFVGALSAHRLGEDAFCHFWIGTDFQGRGFALTAVRLLCAQLRRAGVRRVFTTAYPDNFRSLHVLRRAGFTALSLRALPPEETMPFFGLALDATRPDPVSAMETALRDYCARSGGVFAFATPADAEQEEVLHGG